MDAEKESKDTRSCLIKDAFDRVVKSIRNEDKLSSSNPFSDETKLSLYGLYKQATAGRLIPDDNGQPKPPLWNIVALRKYNAWMQCGDMSEDEAMLKYMKVIAGQGGDTAMLCSDLLQKLGGSEVTESTHVTASSDCLKPSKQ